MKKHILTGYQIYHGFLSGYINLSHHRKHINDINVFPVPDGDTGNNMVRTFRTIANGMVSSRSVSAVLNIIADLSLEGARGNSGMIVSQFINGLAITLDKKRDIDSIAFGDAVLQSVDYAYKAVDLPQEGTLLTVLSVWAAEIGKASQLGIPFQDILRRGFEAAQVALSKTPEQLEILKENGVVDAGALGFVRFLEGIEQMNVSGLTSNHKRKKINVQDTLSSGKSSDNHMYNMQRGIKNRYCTELLIENPNLSPDEIKSAIKEWGDSIIVSQGRHRYRIHIHTNEPHEIVGVLTPHGNILKQKVEDMVRQEQMTGPERIAVLTDSIADIPLEILDAYKIHVINLNLIWDDDEYLDRLTITPEEFYRQQEVRKSFPGSSLPDQSFIDGILQSLMDHYDGIIVIPVAKALSGTWQQISNAAKPYNEGKKKIYVIDSCLNSAAQGLLVVEIAKAASEGKNLDELALMAERLKKRTRIFVSVNTLKFMVKGGRISPLTGLIARTLNLKPIVSLDETGKGMAFDKAFSRRGLLKKISLLIQKTMKKNGIERFVIVHAGDIKGARVFAGLVQKITGLEADYITDISPIVGMHSGKGAIAIGLIENEKS
ncbi:DegV family protein [Oceanispirochaeta sp.]|jgi:DegV family protein with EDD domain|uniref:DegV family protein n=1 Tax=Oceanispirochaeta sp. TaxID=2035350 RepID=UPI00261A1704|nr:DegV family protein [Oceanispirochaeta sp.]MDA3958790.1 DegV family EDD domain-containing protein [Oceanispirochaeta sp.]